MMLDHCQYDPTSASYGRGTKLLQYFLQDRSDSNENSTGVLRATKEKKVDLR